MRHLTLFPWRGRAARAWRRQTGSGCRRPRPPSSIFTRVAAQASCPVAGSAIGARMASGLAPRPLAYRVNVPCPCPTGIATASGPMPGEITTGARNAPCAEAISTTSPSAIPSRAATPRLTSTQLLHIAVVSGSGSSCSQGRCASEPSSSACDAKGRKWNGYSPASPSSSGPPHAVGAGVAPARGRPAAAGVGSALAGVCSISSKVCHGIAGLSGRISRRPASSSTSGMARVS